MSKVQGQGAGFGLQVQRAGFKNKEQVSGAGARVKSKEQSLYIKVPDRCPDRNEGVKNVPQNTRDQQITVNYLFVSFS